MISKNYLEGVAFIVGGTSHVPGGLSGGQYTADHLYASLVLNGWDCPDHEQHLAALRSLPADFPFSATEVREGVFDFARK